MKLERKKSKNPQNFKGVRVKKKIIILNLTIMIIIFVCIFIFIKNVYIKFSFLAFTFSNISITCILFYLEVKSQQNSPALPLIATAENIPQTLSILTKFRGDLTKLINTVLNSIFATENTVSDIKSILSTKSVFNENYKKFLNKINLEEAVHESVNINEVLNLNGFINNDDVSRINTDLDIMKNSNEYLAAKLQLHDIIEQQLSALSRNLEKLYKKIIDNEPYIRENVSSKMKKKLKLQVQEEFKKIRYLSGLSNANSQGGNNERNEY